MIYEVTYTEEVENKPDHWMVPYQSFFSDPSDPPNPEPQLYPEYVADTVFAAARAYMMEVYELSAVECPSTEHAPHAYSSLGEAINAAPAISRAGGRLLKIPGHVAVRRKGNTDWIIVKVVASIQLTFAEKALCNQTVTTKGQEIAHGVNG